ncbi:MAG TPA: histidinol dehydrogenase [Mycobacteriales bacterium]|nr:histidinol dehydrogenase [Mycobacteriales bacterium]HVX69264.1 histidinol dehydrogenase [Mycobacteriales bacterium]
MISRLDLRGRGCDARELPRARLDVEAAVASVRPMVEAVRDRGRDAVIELTERFDGVRLEELRVPHAALGEALAGLDPAVRAALEEAIDRARRVHEAQLRVDEVVDVAPGAVVTERWVPVGRVGLYVPGGLVAYPSSVVMNVVPAQVAGVGSLAVASPPKPQFNGRPNPAVLAACALLGVDEVYSVGGAQAIAMFAYGVEGVAPVDLVTGPGNVYVAAAKRCVRGVVGIDAEAGPTEIGILADDSAEADYVAADLVAQAEHDELAACLLVTPSEQLLDAVDVALAKRVGETRHRERVETALTGQSAYVLVDDIEQGLQVVDAWGAEHLEVITRDAGEVAAKVRNAGAIFVGPWSPVSLGDYLAGSNHVLPTGGTARHTSGLSVQSFLRGIHVIDYTRDALAAVGDHIAALGGAEDLAAHVEAVATRLR